MKKRLKVIWLRLHKKHICEHEGCLDVGIQCRLTIYNDDYSQWYDEYYWYCTEHCHINGFCWYCGEFWGGCEAFDFEPTGCCPNCKDEFKADVCEDDFEDEYEDFLYDIQEENAYQVEGK